MSIKIENIDVYGFETAIRGMRNPMNSWDKSDSGWKIEYDEGGWDAEFFHIGMNDLDLMNRLFKAGTEHRKYLRFINVTMDITAPLYWWKEFDTYKIGTNCNSCSTMHKIHAKEFTLDDFSHEHLDDDSLGVLEYVIANLNECRKLYVHGDQCDFYEIKPKCKDYWWQMIQLLPSSYNQRRTVQMSYEVAVRMIQQRKNHKLDEWHCMTDVLIDLPYMKEIMGCE
jgi:hypothetical protein